MEISKTFVVKAPAATAWAFLTDPHRVAACLPGAAVTGQLDERTYAGTVTVKVGPVSASYKGTMRFERLDEATWTAEIAAAGQDVRGKGGADMRMTSRLVERAPAKTEIAVVSQVNVMGVLAQFGRGMIQDVSDQMFEKFADCARAGLEAAAATKEADAGSTIEVAAAPVPDSAAPIDVVALGTGAVGRAALRTARRPIVWVVVLVLLAALYWLWRR